MAYRPFKPNALRLTDFEQVTVRRLPVPIGKPASYDSARNAYYVSPYGWLEREPYHGVVRRYAKPPSRRGRYKRRFGKAEIYRVDQRTIAIRRKGRGIRLNRLSPDDVIPKGRMPESEHFRQAFYGLTGIHRSPCAKLLNGILLPAECR